MKCSVCGGDIGLWAKLSGHSSTPICKKCQEQGRKQIQVMEQSIGASPLFKAQYANGWIQQFEEIVKKYQIPASEANPQRLAILNSVFNLIKRGDDISQEDAKFILDTCQKYQLPQEGSPELRDTLFCVAMKQTIHSWEHGCPPQCQCQGGLVLQKAEICHWEETAGLRIQKTKREYVGGYSSVSVPVPMVRGVRFRVGGFKGHPIDHTILDDGGTGVLHITNQRICFTGPQHSVAIPFKKMINVQGYEDGFMVQTSNEKKPGIFIVPHPELTTHMLTLACNPPQPRAEIAKEVPSRA